MNEETSTVYFFPPEGLELAAVTVKIVRLVRLITLSGTARHQTRIADSLLAMRISMDASG